MFIKLGCELVNVSSISVIAPYPNSELGVNAHGIWLIGSSTNDPDFIVNKESFEKIQDLLKITEIC